MTSYKNLYKNKVVDPSKKGCRAKFEPDMTSTFAKNGQKTVSPFSLVFAFLAFLISKLTLKFNFDLIRPT